MRVWNIYRMYLDDRNFSKVHKIIKNNSENVVRMETKALNRMTALHDSPMAFFYKEVKG